MGRVASAALVVLGCLSASACVRPPPEAEARLAEVEAEARALEAELDGVEERLLGNQMRLHLWTELAARHRTVSALACRNAEAHMDSIVRHFEKTEQVFRKRRTRRVASPTGAPDRSAVQAGLGGPMEGD